MYIDLSDLEPTQDKPEKSHMRLCGSCMCILPSYHNECPSCEVPGTLIPYLDRRPLILERDTRNSILGLIDEGVKKLTDDVLTDRQSYLSDDYLPFLTRMLQESETAEKLRTMGNHTAYRSTNETTDEVISHLRDMIIPPTFESGTVH